VSVAVAVRAPLRLPLFRSWWAALQLSNAGTWMQQVAAGFVMYEMTSSALMVGALGLAQRGPSLVLTLLGGRLADRRDRRNLLSLTLAMQAVSAAALTAVALAGTLSPLTLIVASVVGGAAQALQYPAQLATITSLVPDASVHAAVSLNSAGFNLARVVGPAAAGALLLHQHGASICFAANTASYLFPLLIVRRLPATSAGGQTGSATVRGGLVHAWRSPPLRRLIGGCAIFAACAAPLTVLAPAYAAAVGGGPGTLGLLLAAFGVGAVAGAAVAVRVARRIGRHRLIPAAMLLYAIFGGGAALAETPVAASVLCAAAGACWVAVFASTNASIQLIAADAIRGRLLSLYLWSLVGPMALSGLAVGALAGLVGIRTALAVAVMTPVGLQHVSVPCPAHPLPACRRFYEVAMGMAPVTNLAGVAWFAFGDGFQIHLLDGEGLAATAAHFAVQVDDLAATLERCREQGCAAAEQPRYWDAERWFVRDPAGNMLELFEIPPPR
jgi:MFS family permease